MIMKYLGLSKFIVMMGELQIHTTRMNVQRLSAYGRSHHRALNVPARASKTPRRFPRGFTRFGAFPKSKVHWSFLLLQTLLRNTQVTFREIR